MFAASSQTVRPDGQITFSIFGHLGTTMKFQPNSTRNLPKWRKFRRIWSHCSQTKGDVVCIVVAIPLISCVAAFLPEKKGTQQSICKDLETYIPRYRLLFYLPAQQRLAGKGFYTARLKGYKFLIISRQATKEFLGNLG